MSELKMLADSMDQLREKTWKKRARSAQNNHTIVKTLEMKNEQRA